MHMLMCCIKCTFAVSKQQKRTTGAGVKRRLRRARSKSWTVEGEIGSMVNKIKLHEKIQRLNMVQVKIDENKSKARTVSEMM